MFRKSSQMNSPLRDPVAVLLIVSGSAFGLWVHQSDGQDFEMMMATSISDAAIREHNRTSPNVMRDISEMTTEERRAAKLRVLARDRAVAEAELSRIRDVILVGSVGLCCWLGGLTRLLLRKPLAANQANDQQLAIVERRSGFASAVDG